MKIFITGVGGFIGSHTAKKLAEQGNEIIGLDNLNDYYSPKIKQRNIEEIKNKYPKNFNFIKGDILDQEQINKIFKKEKFKKVCHLAARAGVRPSIKDPFLYEEVNVRGTLNLLEISKNHQIENFVYASSSSVYGECQTTPFLENLKLDKPISPYAASKKANENYAYTYSHLYGLPTIGLRFFTVYGPYGRPDMAPFLFTKWIKNGETLKQFGDGETERDYTYIDDITDGILSAINLKTNYEIFNLGNNKPVKLKNFIEIIEKKLGKKAKIKILQMQQGDVKRTYADINHAKNKLNFNPKINLEEGMEKFINWYNLFF